MTYIGQTYVLTHTSSSLPSVPAQTSALGEVRALCETEVSGTSYYSKLTRNCTSDQCRNLYKQVSVME